MSNRLHNAPLGTKAPAIGGGHWVKVATGWRWWCGDTFPRPGGDWDGSLQYPAGYVLARGEVAHA